MHLKLLLLIGAVLPAVAQFESLSTPDDGSILFFTTRLRQAGTDQPAHGKLFIADHQGVRPLMIRNRDWTPMELYGQPGLGVSNYYDVIGVDIAGDGSRLATVALRDCRFSEDMCVYTDQSWTTVYDRNGQESSSFKGCTRLSSNGRWGIAKSKSSMPTAAVIDIDAGTRYDLPSTYMPYRGWRANAIANNGTAVWTSTDLMIFRPPDQVQTVKAQPDSAAIDAEGTTVVWADGIMQRSLHILHATATTEAVSLAVPDRDDFAPSLSNDGTRILFLSRLIDSNRPQVFVVKPDGTLRRQVTNEAEGIASAILSGNGAVAWALTRTGRVLRVDVGSNAITQVIGQVPALLAESNYGAPGEVMTVEASVLGNEPLTVDVGGTAWPPLNVGDGTVTFQIPWDLPPSATVNVGLRTTARTAWEGQTMKLASTATNARFVSDPTSGYSLAAHQEWQSLVTLDRPAEAGEIVHLYAVGLGAVTPPAALMRCSTSGNPAREVGVLYAGLAPGTIGYYQVSLRLPTALAAFTTSVVCVLGPSGYPNFTATLPTRINAAP
jgi:uncharacterized protein (TIGR03437 family)